MGRKTIEATAADRLSRASAEAAAILAGDLAACSHMMRHYLGAAVETADEDVRAEFARTAADLAGAVAKLSSALAQIRGETRHRIDVKRAFKSGENSPQLHRNAP
jgi:hypothetical protein